MAPMSPERFAAVHSLWPLFFQQRADEVIE
jgi:hypothetical protein